jgi:hypothetical protein
MEGIEVTNDELNKFIHETVMGECWHELTIGFIGCPYLCGKCDVGSIADIRQDNLDYCSSLDAAAKAEARAIEKFHRGSLMTRLNIIVGWLEYAEFATAHQRCEAIYQLYTNEGD